MSFILRTIANALTMLLRHCRPRGRIGIQPMKNQCLYHALGIGKMLRAIVLKRVEDLGVEAICSLDGTGFCRGLAFCHVK
jgi:hypothetical protein